MIDVVSECPLRVAGLGWLLSTGEPALTVICKATYLLQPGESKLAPDQDPPNEEDNHWDDDPRRSLSAASDMAPFKARPEVLLVGHAFAPQGQPARSLFVRLVVGNVDKSLEVYADRAWSPERELREGQRFAKMRLCYERAAASNENPVGMSFDGPPDARGMMAVPNIQPPGVLVSRPEDRFASVGFGPLAPSWPTRRERLRRYAGSWLAHGWETRALPADFDPGFFNAAPQDQQLDELRPGERLTLEGLHLVHARLVTNLPGVRPRAMLERPGRAAEEVRLRADTLWIDTDRGVCTLVWRGALPVGRGDTGRVVVTAETASGERLGPPLAEDDAGTGTLLGAFPLRQEALPFQGGGVAEGVAPRGVMIDGALPFGAGGGARVPAPAVAGDGVETLFLAGAAAAALMEAAGAGGAVVQAEPARVAGVPPVVAQPVVQAPLPVPPTARLSLPEIAVPDRQSIGQKLLSEPASPPEKPAHAPPPKIVEPAAPPAPAVRVDEGAAKRGWKPAGAPSAATPPVVAAVSGSALAASNAAAAAARSAPMAENAPAKATPLRVAATPRETLELIWFDPAFVSRMRKKPGWKEIMAQAKARPNDEEASGDTPPDKRQELRDRREVFALLARGEAIDMRGVEAAMGEAVGEDGGFVPPLVLVAGQLELPFDEVEELKATVAAMTPLVAGDVRLQAAVDTAQKLLQTPWLNGASEIAEGLTGKVKEAFAQGNRALPPRYLEQHTERMLLQQRAYQKRMVLGKASIRGLLSMGGGAAAEGVPVYLPESLGQELPAFLKLGVRMVAEARWRVDQYESQGVAMKGVAVGRVVARR